MSELVRELYESDAASALTNRAAREIERLTKENDAALAEIAQLKAQREWQPIETAPKDGTWILAINAATNSTRQHVVHYSERYGTKFPWVRDSGPMEFVAGLTHWMQLPVAPQPPENKA